MASLSEIANIKGDADLAQGGFGTDAVLPENNTALAYLHNAADLQAGANKYLAEVHNKRMEDYLTNFNNIDLKNLAPGDYDQLSKQYVDLSKDLADNADVLQNSFKNPQLAGSLRSREAALRSQIAQSQMDKGTMDITNNHIQLHPDLNTTENQKKIQDYWKTPLGKRMPVSLTPASVINLQGIADSAWNSVQQKYATATTDGKYIWKKEGLTAAADAYTAAVDSHLNDTDQYGRTNRQLITNAFGQLTPEDQAKYKNNPLNWYHTQMLALKHPDQQTKADLDTDQFGTIKAQGAQTRQTEGMRETYETKAATDKYDRDLVLTGMKQFGSGKVDPNTVGEYKNKLYHDFVTGTSHDQATKDDFNKILGNPNLTLSQKSQMVRDLSAKNENALGENLPNEVFQQLYGNNKKVKVKNGLAGETQTEQELPAEQVIGNRMSANGQAFITLKNNVNGGVHSMYVPISKLYNDLNNVLGPDKAPMVSLASKNWLQKNTGSLNPDLDKISSALNSPSLKANYQLPDGKTYSHEQLKGIGYTDDQIKQALQLGNIK